ncbi:MAG: UDP-N-acetylmuramoyl-L-alanyl-D-glutamate--2,6-diaminopimelate ligase [Mariprofundaceae bacterium]|nr:UDP-N-acetylmuramoyl-L-alanyl-D-glutamate--2,6-diaminopimelate ligase [Mariprofundaceae bacterium]
MNKQIYPAARQLSSLATNHARISQDVVIAGIHDNSANIQPGDAFLCLPRTGKSTQKYIEIAQKKGASAIILVGHDIKPDLPYMHLANMQAAGRMLRRWFNTEKSQVKLIGITGTDGKTSTTWMLRQAIQRLGFQAWSIGTLGCMYGENNCIELGNTTPSLLKMHQLYAQAHAAKVDTIVCEISSHGIEQQRIAGLDFCAALWTNLGHDHIDDHGSFQNYANIKAHFLQQTYDQKGIIFANADCPNLKAFAPKKTRWYGQGLYRKKAIAMAWEQEIPSMLRLKPHTKNETDTEILIEDLPLGDFHAENTTAVAAILCSIFHTKITQLPEALNHITAPPGRLQSIGLGAWQAFIDYAHTPEALERCLRTVRLLCRYNIYLVFGCGGDRDKEKRPIMGNIATKFADHLWLTSDNPRSETPQVIIQDIFQGIPSKQHHKVHRQVDRRIAIFQAVNALQTGDILLIAGKGHESYMETNDNRIAWSDQDIAINYLRQKQRSPHDMDETTS